MVCHQVVLWHKYCLLLLGVVLLQVEYLVLSWHLVVRTVVYQEVGFLVQLQVRLGKMEYDKVA